MPRPFAQHYDHLYVDKDYGSDIAALETLVGADSLAGKRVLEIGAGTGNHTLRLASKVGELVSIEIDADFAEVLRSKLEADRPRNVAFFDCLLQSLPESNFDVAAAFFHVLNYMGPDQLEEFLGALAIRMKPGGHFVADVWNGSAAMLDPPREELREKQAAHIRVLQRIHPRLDLARRIVTLNYEIVLNDGISTQNLNESIDLFLWFPEELEAGLIRAGFSEVQFWDYRLFPAPAMPESWRLWVRAKRR